MDIITNSDEVNQKLKNFLKHEANTYRNAGIAALVLGIGLFFLFWMIGVLLLITAGYLFFSQAKNVTKPARLYLGRIDKKVRFDSTEYMETTLEAVVHEKRMFEVINDSAFDLNGKTQVSVQDFKGKMDLVITQDIYDSFETGDEFIYLFSPAEDLLGYALQGEIQLLFEKREIGGKMVDHSMAITQNDPSKGESWRRKVEQ